MIIVKTFSSSFSARYVLGKSCPSVRILLLHHTSEQILMKHAMSVRGTAATVTIVTI